MSILHARKTAAWAGRGALVAAVAFLGWTVVAAAGPSLTVEVSASAVAARTSSSAALELHVEGPGDRSFVERGEGSVRWTLPADASGGLYRWEVFASAQGDDRQDSASSGDKSSRGESAVTRKHGRFTVEGGTIRPPRQGDQSAKRSGDRDWRQRLARLAAATLNTVVSPAHAASDHTSGDKTISGELGIGLGSGDFPLAAIEISKSDPKIEFDDTDISAAAGYEWSITADEVDFRIRRAASDGSLDDRIIFTYDSPNANTLIEDSNGDIEFADGTLFLDRGANELGIGTTTPATNLHMVDSFPYVRLEDSTDSPDWDIENNNGRFDLYNGTNNDVFSVLESGAVGIGTTSPKNRLHTFKDDGTESAPLRVDNPSGKARFVIRGGSDVWTFDNTAANAFTISKVGTGVAEMSVSGSGDMTIQGTLSEGSSRAMKTAIEAVDPSAILSRLADLDLSEWSYEDSAAARHLGPMAEDFHELFGLGRDKKHIAPKDMAGVAMASAKALREKLQSQQERLAAQQRTNEELRQALAAKEDRIERMEKRLERLEAAVLEE